MKEDKSQLNTDVDARCDGLQVASCEGLVKRDWSGVLCDFFKMKRLVFGFTAHSN